MKALQYHRLLFIGLLWLLSPLAWAQAPPVLPGKPAEPVVSQSEGRVAGDSLATDRPQRQVRQQTLLRRVNKSQSNQPVRQRIQMPKRTQATMPILVFFSAALGALLFMSLFTGAQYLLNRDAPYGWYALYLMTTAIWLWQSTRVWFNGIPQPPDLPVFFAYMLLLGYSMMVSYVRFISYLLEVSQQPRLERWTRYFLRFAALSVLVLLAELFIWNSIYVYLTVNFLNYSGLLFLMANMLRRKHALKRYALAGSILLVSGAITATFLTISVPKRRIS